MWYDYYRVRHIDHGRTKGVNMKFMIRCDVEGVTAVVGNEHAEPGHAKYEFGCAMCPAGSIAGIQSEWEPSWVYSAKTPRPPDNFTGFRLEARLATHFCRWQL